MNALKKKFGAMHFMYYINRSIATKVDLLLTNSTQRICLVVRGGREPVTSRAQSPTLYPYTTHVDKCYNYYYNILLYTGRILYYVCYEKASILILFFTQFELSICSVICIAIIPHYAYCSY